MLSIPALGKDFEAAKETMMDTENNKAIQERVITEEFKVSGEAVVAKVKELVREGNIRRITFKNEEGKTLIEIPLTIGVIGSVLLPVWASIGAIAALVANLTITVERPAEAPPASFGTVDEPS
jgi:DNA-binding Lrp family transcriptional regulator